MSAMSYIMMYSDAILDLPSQGCALGLFVFLE
jgi:hypothetical protein